MAQTKNSGLVVLAALAALLIGSPASATYVSTCRIQIDTLIVSTKGSPVKDKDEAALIAKLSEANLKLDAAKFSDAKQKVSDYLFKLNQLNSQGKIDDKTGQTYSELSGAANEILKCITDIGS